MSTILVVDDEKIIDEALQQRLQEAGLKIISFLSPGDALLYFEEHPSSVDLAIIDHDMPGVIGPDLAMKFRAMMPELPIIIIAGGQEGIEFGDYTLLRKPAAKDVLLEAVEHLLAEKARIYGNRRRS